MTTTPASHQRHGISLHQLGVITGLTAGVWLGAAEAPTKLVDTGLSPFAISLCMVAGVFTARWTFPTLLKGTGFVMADLASKKHLIVWALLAGALWAVANTLTVFAIRDVGLAIAFPLWNANALIGLFWARVLFRELQGARASVILRVFLGSLAIIGAAILLGFASMHGTDTGHAHRAFQGILAAFGASLMWGTMYVPYRKAYLSGMNPLSFVTAFTVGELVTMLILAVTLGRGSGSGAGTVFAELRHAPGVLFWLFLGGFVWVVGDLFQQYAAKYLGIGRGIPLSNTNQLWGLAWGAMVFGELVGSDRSHILMVLAGSVVMIGGAALISSAAATGKEQSSRNQALLRECDRYGLNYRMTLLNMDGEADRAGSERRWWDYAIVLLAAGIFVYLGAHAHVPALHMNFAWMLGLGFLLLLSFIVGAVCLWRRTSFT